MSRVTSRGVTLPKVVESGSNDNGDYVKFEDGTMICLKKVSISINGTWDSDGTFYYKKISGCTFPCKFSGVPFIVANFDCNDSARHCWCETYDTTISGTNIGIYTYWNASYTLGFVNIIAIGKWK